MSSVGSLSVSGSAVVFVVVSVEEGGCAGENMMSAIAAVSDVNSRPRALIATLPAVVSDGISIGFSLEVIKTENSLVPGSKAINAKASSENGRSYLLDANGVDNLTDRSSGFKGLTA